MTRDSSADTRQAVIKMPAIHAHPFGTDASTWTPGLLDPAQKIRLAECSSVVRMRKDTVVFGEGSESACIYSLSEGMIETCHLLASGQRRITAFMFPDDLFGLSEHGRYCMTAQAITPIVAYRIPLAKLSYLMREDPSLQLYLLCKACHEIREAQQHVLQIGHAHAQARIAAFLLLIARHNRGAAHQEVGAAEPGQLALPMSRSDIADFSALTRESVSRALGTLEEAGLIRRDSSHLVTLLDEEGLRREAGEF